MKKYSLEDIKALITQMGSSGGKTHIEDDEGNLYDIDKVVGNIEKISKNSSKMPSKKPLKKQKKAANQRQIQKLKNDINVNFRWSEYEVNRIKKIAAAKGMPYQTYIKFALKQIIDKEENN